jgi:hypothetical protein
MKKPAELAQGGRDEPSFAGEESKKPARRAGRAGVINGAVERLAVQLEVSAV